MSKFFDNLAAESLKHEDIMLAFPLVSMAYPGLKQDRWRRFAAEPGVAARQKRGCLAVLDKRRIPHAVSTYTVLNDPIHGKTLRASHFVSGSFPGSQACALLLEALFGRARETGCNVLEMVLPTGKCFHDLDIDALKQRGFVADSTTVKISTH
jgi:hypothetical protein